jgi:hypothetical protein
MSFGRLLVLPCVLLGLTQPGRAEIVYNFGQGGSIGLSDFAVVAGDQLVLDIYATQQGQFEAVPGFFFSDTRLSQDFPRGDGSTRMAGVGSYSFDVIVVDADTPMASQTDILPEENFAFGTGFVDDTTSGINPGTPNVLRASSFATDDVSTIPPVIIPVAASNTETSAPGVDVGGTIAENSVLLGTVTLNVASQAEGIYDLSIESVPAQFLIGDSVQLDPFITVPTLNATIIVTAVPEPTTWAACSLGLGVVALRHRRRRRARSKPRESRSQVG